MKKEALRVSTTIPAAPTTLYLAWLSSEQHSEMTGATAKLDPSVGSKFTALNGYISGKLVILDLGRRIVMSWRTTDFPREEPDSRVEVHFEAMGDSTRLTVLHADIPEGQGEQYRTVWNDKYFAPMRSFFSKYLPDPRKPPPPRPPPPSEEELAEEEEQEEEEEPPTKLRKGLKAPLSSKKVVAEPPPAPKSKVPAKAAPPKSAPAKAAPPKSAPAKAAPAKPTAKPAPAKAAPAKPTAKAAPAKKPAAKAGAKKSAAKTTAGKPVKKKK